MLKTELKNSQSQAPVDPELVEIEKCRKSFAHFLGHVKTKDSQRQLGIIPIALYAYIISVANAFQNFRLNLVLKPRQMLISWVLAAYAVWKCNFTANMDVLIMSENEEKAKKLKMRADIIIENLPAYLRGAVKSNELEMKWANGSVLNILPCTENNARSLSASLIIIDEAAFMKWGSIMFSGIGPAIDTFGQLIIVSTPNAHDGLFYPLWHQKDSPFNKIELSYQDHPGRDKTWAEKMISLIGHMRFLREYRKSFEVAAGKPVYDIFEDAQIQPCYQQWDVNKPVLVGVDRGFHHPALVFEQINSYDQMMIMRLIQGQDIGLTKFLKEAKQQMDTWFPNQFNRGGYKVFIPPDAKEKEAEGETWDNRIHEIWGVYSQPPRNDDIRRRVQAAYKRMGLRQDGRYGTIIDPACELLISAFKGGYAYPENINKAEDEKPHKDDVYDHTCNAHEAICDQIDAQVNKPNFPEIDAPVYNEITGRPIG